MYFEQFYLGCLAHASYMLGSEGEAIVVDPQRDVEIYLEAAEKNDLTIRHIFETHLHADFVSGHKELAKRTGATIYVGAAAAATFPHIAVRDNYNLRVGRMRLRVLETPGHTPESICLLVVDDESSDPGLVLTGDTLFVGDVGRPDLSPTHTPQQLAGLLYDSLHTKLMTLPSEVKVYPAHGAGSLCGKNMRAERSSTIATERLSNYALQIKSRDEFIQQLTANLPPRPEYFPLDAAINRDGAAALSDLPSLAPIAPHELKAMLDDGVYALDVRPGPEFVASHVPRSINIALSGQFASWAATVFGLDANPALIADTDQQIAEARMRLARVGLEKVRGYLAGGVNAWKQAGLPLATMPQITVQELYTRLQGGGLEVLDVRRGGEWDAGHIAGAQWHALDSFKTTLPELSRDTPVAVHCKGGYRSLIACSLLQRAGYDNVIDVAGGYDGWVKEQLPVSSLQSERAAV